MDEERKITLPKECFAEIIFGAEMTEEQMEYIMCVCYANRLKINFKKSKQIIR